MTRVLSKAIKAHPSPKTVATLVKGRLVARKSRSNQGAKRAPVWYIRVMDALSKLDMCCPCHA